MRPLGRGVCQRLFMVGVAAIQACYSPMKQRGPSLVVVAIVALACEPGTAPLGQDQAEIFYGEATSRPDVVAVGYGPEYYVFCTGTLITSHVVLTAAHCLIGESPSDIQVFFGDDANTGAGEWRQASELLVHDGYSNDTLNSDIALIRMASPAPESIRPIPHLPVGLGLSARDVGATVEYAGFGLTENGTDGIKLASAGTILGVCTGPGLCFEGLAVPRSFYYSMDGGGPCSGDSGGPTFLQRDREYVAGVTSYGDEACVEYGVNTSVSEYAGWIDAFLAAGGSEDCDNGVDDDANGAADCDDERCSTEAICVPVTPPGTEPDPDGDGSDGGGGCSAAGVGASGSGLGLAFLFLAYAGRRPRRRASARAQSGNTAR